jgi:hypothetical protein
LSVPAPYDFDRRSQRPNDAEAIDAATQAMVMGLDEHFNANAPAWDQMTKNQRNQLRLIFVSAQVAYAREEMRQRAARSTPQQILQPKLKPRLTWRQRLGLFIAGA